MTEAGRCAQCGTELLDAPPGVCPAYLLKLGLSGAIPVEPPVAEAAAPAVAAVSRRKLPWALMATVLVALAGLSSFFFRRAPTEPRQVKLAVPPPAKTTLGTVAVSPDGGTLAFTATGDDGRVQLWLRTLDSLEARPVAGTDGASFPFWSPDSRYLGFFADRKLKRLRSTEGRRKPFATLRVDEAAPGIAKA